MQIKKDERNEIKTHHIQDTIAGITSYLHRSIEEKRFTGS